MNCVRNLTKTGEIAPQRRYNTSMERSRAETTALLNRVCQGSGDALQQLVPRVYEELHRIAQWQMKREAEGHTLQPTALVNEAYLRLIDQSAGWKDRSHFFALAAQAMRRVLVDHARARRAGKRGGGLAHDGIDEQAVGVDAQLDRMLAVDEALKRLAAFDPRQCQIVEMRYFAGMSDPEISAILGVSVRTVNRDWRIAKAWLYNELGAKAALETT